MSARGIVYHYYEALLACFEVRMLGIQSDWIYQCVRFIVVVARLLGVTLAAVIHRKLQDQLSPSNFQHEWMVLTLLGLRQKTDGW